MEQEKRLFSLAPLNAPNATVLLLGSMPGAASLARQEYYAHPQNHFWPLIFTVIGETCPPVYAQRMARLSAHGIALWDSIRACERKSSLDKDIRNAEPNDIEGYLAKYSTIRAVAFNGTMSEKIYCCHFKAREGIRYLLLPSSSPVPRRHIKRLEDKIPAWMVLREYIR